MDDRPTTDDIFNVLNASRRRYVLEVLYNQGPLWKKELQKRVAVREFDMAFEELGHKEKQTIKTTLIQDHLPPLNKHNFIMWDKETNAIALGPHSDLVLRKLDGIELENGFR